MVYLRLGIPLEGDTGLLQQFRGHREVPLSVSNGVMPQIRGKVWQQALDILAFPIPSKETNHSEGVTIMPRAA